MFSRPTSVCFFRSVIESSNFIPVFTSVTTFTLSPCCLPHPLAFSLQMVLIICMEQTPTSTSHSSPTPPPPLPSLHLPIRLFIPRRPGLVQALASQETCHLSAPLCSGGSRHPESHPGRFDLPSLSSTPSFPYQSVNTYLCNV